MKRLKKTTLFVITMLFVSIFSSCDMYSYVTPSTQVRYDNPAWAPPYVQGVRYYYLPDIETYYDLTTQQFVYLYNGQWHYSQVLPSIYAGFDLDNCFTVAIDYNTYQPWLHYQYYVSHYPRYYYRDYYDHSNIPYVRGYNENSRSAIYWSERERDRARRWDNENLKRNHQFKYSDSDRRQQQNNSYDNYSGRTPDTKKDYRTPDNKYDQPQQPERNDKTVTPRRPDNGVTNRDKPEVRDNISTRPTPSSTYNSNRQQGENKRDNVTPSREAGNDSGSRQQNGVSSRTDQKTNYYGRTIGQPVKVEKQMRERVPVTETKRTEAKDTPKASGTRNGRDSKDENDNSRRDSR